jgi:LytS/YehU family sensor histidine kinase
MPGDERSALSNRITNKAVQQTLVRSILRKREQIATLREELTDLNDYLDLTEARVRDQGKRRLTHAEVKKRCGVK